MRKAACIALRIAVDVVGIASIFVMILSSGAFLYGLSILVQTKAADRTSVGAGLLLMSMAAAGMSVGFASAALAERAAERLEARQIERTEEVDDAH